MVEKGPLLHHDCHIHNDNVRPVKHIQNLRLTEVQLLEGHSVEFGGSDIFAGGFEALVGLRASVVGALAAEDTHDLSRHGARALAVVTFVTVSGHVLPHVVFIGITVVGSVVVVVVGVRFLLALAEPAAQKPQSDISSDFLEAYLG